VGALVGALVGVLVGAVVGALEGAIVGDLVGDLVGALVGLLVGLGVARVTSSWQNSHENGQPFLIFLLSRPITPEAQYVATLCSATAVFFVSHEHPTIFPFACTVNS